MNLALFDLDNTLLAGDSDYLWGRFLVDEGVVDPTDYEHRNREFFQQYQAGTLDIHAYARFALRPLAENALADLHRWREAFVQRYIRPIILPRGVELVDAHRRREDTCLIITSTNRFITEPIAEILAVDDLIASRPAFEDGHFTGRFEGTPCFREGKVACLEDWLRDHGGDMTGSSFYSDSLNDLPLLQRVAHPIAVDADEKLAEYASRHGWRHLSLR